MKKVDEKLKKNCLNCDCLDYWEGEYESFSAPGFYCMKRQDSMTTDQEHEFVKRMEKDSYLKTSKRCFEEKEAK